MTTWKQHWPVLALLMLSLIGGSALSLSFGTLKPVSAIDWYDVAGEGITLLVACGWLALVVCSRPLGRVSYYLTAGSSLLIWSYYLDFLDEFFKYPDASRLLSLLESIPAPFGMLLLTAGVAGWMREQRMLNRQLLGREHFLRDHKLLDPLTKLYSRTYLEFALEREVHLRRPGSPLSLLLVDIEGFAHYNHRQGAAAGDRLLVTLAEWLLVRMRPADLLCRYAGDRFVLMLPDTHASRAERLGQHLQRRFVAPHESGAHCALRYRVFAADQASLEQLLAALASSTDKTRDTPAAGQWLPA